MFLLDGNLLEFCLFLFQVLKFGTALGRSVDLTRFYRYDELIRELDQMFDFKGSLIDGSSGWHVAYTDYEGDMMLIGDYPWQLSGKSAFLIVADANKLP